MADGRARDLPRTWGARADGFLFAPTNARAVAWLRVAFGLVAPYFVLSSGTAPEDPQGAIGWLYENVVLTRGYWLLIAACGLLLAAGWRPRVCAALLILLLIPMLNLSRGTHSRGVLLFALAAFAFLRSDAVPSPWKRRGRSEVEGSAGPAWPIRLIQLELTVVYGVNALAKSHPRYLSGDALIDMSAALPNFLVDMRDGVLELGPLAIPVALAAAASAAAEWFLALGFWIFPRWRWVVAAAGVAFHWVLTHIVQIFMLNLASMFLYLTFLLPLVKAPGPTRAPSPAGEPTRQPLPL